MFEDAPGYSREVDMYVLLSYRTLYIRFWKINWYWLFYIRWACGVIMFTLLVGCPPFWHRKQMIMLRNIMEGKYSFMSPEWSDISGELWFYWFLRIAHWWRSSNANVWPNHSSLNFNLQTFNKFLNFSTPTEDPKDLIRKCLVVDPEKRITVREALKHPFFNTVVSTLVHFHIHWYSLLSIINF